MVVQMRPSTGLVISLFLARAAATLWHQVRLTDPLALCLDGTVGTFEIKPGVGANASKFLLFQQAGGWAMSPEDLLFRSKTSLGSTRGDAATSSAWDIEDLMTNDTARNPYFSTWTSVALRYCDGASRSSHLDGRAGVLPHPFRAAPFHVYPPSLSLRAPRASGGERHAAVPPRL